ncbi:MAG: metal-dependent transcriptional regulator [Verrucomicrobiota bacterium]|nr:metal-dependent transcriptional regulator [Verrucomicrobiota bacterium]
MATSTVENYLKEILVITLEEDVAKVPMGQVAKVLGVTPGTATSMAKSMERDGWIRYFPRVGVSLTKKGRKLALSMLRRHRLLETFLVETLGLDWSEIHVEAEELEHAISEKVLEKLDEFLGRPRFDPHGDPIPSKGGVIHQLASKPLSEFKKGAGVRIESIVDQDKEFLHFARKSALVPGQIFKITGKEDCADAITLKTPKGKILNLGYRSAEKILALPCEA